MSDPRKRKDPTIGFTLHWLFIVVVVAALICVVMSFAGIAGGRSRRAW